MVVPSSGEITLLKVHKEKETNAYGDFVPSIPSTAGTELYPSSFGNAPTAYDNTSLENESDIPPFGGTINMNNPTENRPDGSAPDALSEFYSYDHDASSGGGGDPRRCFMGDSKIRMADGTTKNIEDIQVGHEVVVVSGSWPEAHPTGSDWTRMETFLWSFSSGWSGSFSDTNISYSTSSCLLYTSPSPRDATLSRMPSSA